MFSKFNALIAFYVVVATSFAGLLETAETSDPAVPIAFPIVQPSDQSLCCMVNLDGHAIHYPPSRWASVPLITDFSVFVDTVADPTQRYNELLDRAQSTNSDIVIGRYLSGARIQSSFKQYPPEAVNAQNFPSNLLRKGTDRVNLEDPKAEQQFLNLVLDSYRSYPRRVLFLDNIVHPSALPGWIPWHTTCRFLAQIKAALHQDKALLIANIAVAPWAMTDADISLLNDSVDGMAFELPFHQLARKSPQHTARQIEVYRYWLDKRKIVVLIAVPDKSITTEWERELEVRFIASFAMMIRKSGDKLYVAWPFYKPLPDWNDWPAVLGTPLSDCHIDDHMVLKRLFQRAQFEIDTRVKSVRLIPR